MVSILVQPGVLYHTNQYWYLVPGTWYSIGEIAESPSMLGVDRRVALVAGLAAAPQLLRAPAPASAGDLVKAEAVVAGGFLIPSEQYKSYAALFDQIGCSSELYADESTLSRPLTLQAGAESLLNRLDATQHSPLILLGHSRGCKTCIEAAARTKRRVAAMVLLDPVDRTGPDPESVLSLLETLKVPTAILGTGRGDDCAPQGANWAKFEEALGRSSTPRLIGVLPRAGHTQFVDNRRILSVDVCTTGRDKDTAIREVAMSLVSAWSQAALVHGSVGEQSSARKQAFAALQDEEFSAAVEWTAYDL